MDITKEWIQEHFSDERAGEFATEHLKGEEREVEEEIKKHLRVAFEYGDTISIQSAAVELELEDFRVVGDDGDGTNEVELDYGGSASISYVVSGYRYENVMTFDGDVEQEMVQHRESGDFLASASAYAYVYEKDGAFQGDSFGDVTVS